MLMYKIITSETGVGVTVIFSDGTVRQLSDESPNYAEAVALLTSTPVAEIDEDSLQKLLNPGLVVGTTLKRLSERVTFDGTNILFDGDSIDNSIADHLIRILKEDESTDSYMALVNFMEKLYSNPSEKSRNSLYDFIQKHDITIDPDGDFYAYKGVLANGTSINSGFGIVNGVAMNGHLPNNPGSILEMPRTKVDADTAVGCSTGLHAGSFAYANGFAQGMLLLVKINPRDVVSVPDCSAFAKIRTCRYKVVSQIAQQITKTTGAYDGVDNDFEPDVEESALGKLISRVLENEENVDVTFTFTRGNGETLNVEGTVTNIFNEWSDDEGVILETKCKDGKVRNYRYGFLTDLKIVDDESELAMNDILRASMRVIPSKVSVGSTAQTPFEVLREALDKGESVLCDFDYTTVDGESRTLTGFEAEELRPIRYGNELLVGIREDGETRRYRTDRITNLRVAKAETKAVSVEEELLEKIASGETVVCSFDYETAKGEARELQGFEATSTSTNWTGKTLIIGTREDGETRSYRLDRITNLELNKDEEEQADSATEANDLTPFESKEAWANSVNAVGRYSVSFDYVTMSGEDRKVEGFIPEEVRETKDGVALLVGTREDGEIRSYRIDRIINVTDVITLQH